MERFTVLRMWDEKWGVYDRATTEVLAAYTLKEDAKAHAERALISYNKCWDLAQ